jgi:hypothetical protein
MHMNTESHLGQLEGNRSSSVHFTQYRQQAHRVWYVCPDGMRN